MVVLLTHLDYWDFLLTFATQHCTSLEEGPFLHRPCARATSIRCWLGLALAAPSLLEFEALERLLLDDPIAHHSPGYSMRPHFYYLLHFHSNWSFYWHLMRQDWHYFQHYYSIWLVHAPKVDVPMNVRIEAFDHLMLNAIDVPVIIEQKNN